MAQQPWELDWGSEAATQQPWELDWEKQAGPGTYNAADLKPTARQKALATGVFKGLTTGIPGIPMDTVLNLLDLGRAAGGVIGGELFNRPASELPEPINRANVPLSSAYLAKYQEPAAPSLYTNPAPEDPIAAQLHAGGQMAAGSILGPRGAVPLAKNAALAVPAGMAGEAAAQAGLPPSAQLLASMIPAAGATTAAGMSGQRQRALAQQKIHQATHDENIKAAQEAGLVVPPMMVDPRTPGLVNRSLTAAAGKQATEQLASVKNDIKIDNLARRDLGLNPTDRISHETVGKVIEDAGNAGYAPIKTIPNIDLSGGWKALFALKNEYLRQTDPKYGGNRSLANPQALAAIDDSFKPNMTGEQAIDMVKAMRNRGRRNLESEGDAANNLGRYQMKIANIIEGQIEAHLQSTGNTAQYNAFVDARRMIAKSYAYLEALDKGSGHVDATKMAKQYQDGVPLDGNALLIAKAAAVAPQALGKVKSPQPGMGIFGGSIIGGGALAQAFQDPKYLAVAALPYSRVAARELMLSHPWQKYMAHPPNYKPGVASRILPELFPEDISGMAGSYLLQPYKEPQ